MSEMPLKALLVFNERKAFQRLRSAIAAAGSIDFQLVEVDQLDGTLRRLQQDRLDIILVDCAQAVSRLVKVVVRARELAPGVPVVMLPEMRDGSDAAELLRHAAARGMDAARSNRNPVAWAIGCVDRLQQLEGELLRLAL